ncbi:unnamed protein product [Lactuca virosa]|nr:unnamed protein product [Lactuca virosa]
MAFLKDPNISQSISTLANLVISVAQTTANFKPELKLLVLTLERIAPIIQDTIIMNQKLDRPEAEWKMLRDEKKRAIKLVKKCSKIKWNIIKKSAYRQKLKDVNGGVRNPSGSLSSSFRTDQSRCENIEREKYGWCVPELPSGIVAFDEQLEKLKAEVVACINGGGDGSSMDYDYRSLLADVERLLW